MKLRLSGLLFVVPVVFGFVACDGGNMVMRPDAGQPVDAPTYHRDVAPLVQRECLRCHVENGIGPFRLDSYAALVENAANVVDAVEVGYMPPWLPDRECRDYVDSRGLSPAERRLFAMWQEGGLQEGDPNDAPPAPDPPAMFVATDTAHMAEPYTSSSELADDYRCFLLDYTFDADSFVTGHNVVPGAREVVHHVLVYGVTESQLPMVEAADAAADGPGYPCFGGPLQTTEGDQRGSLGLIGLGGWVPGNLPFVAREDRGIYVPSGSRLVMQVHYHPTPDGPVADSTEYQMRVTQTAPSFALSTFPTAILELDIPAGEADARHTRVFRNYRSSALQITGLTPHMHLLGTKIGLSRVPAANAADPQDECLISIDDWDFEWQQSYGIRADDEVVIQPGEGLELTCVYDNSAGNQPFVDGRRQTPVDVAWGEGTFDEMCLLYVQHETPWAGPSPTGCEAAAGCLESCATDDTQCLLSCEGLAGSCRICTLESTLGCARSSCLATLAPVVGCLDTCILSYVLLGGSFDRCMASECPTTWDAARACISGVVDAGTCDADLQGCGIALTR